MNTIKNAVVSLGLLGIIGCHSPAERQPDGKTHITVPQECKAVVDFTPVDGYYDLICISKEGNVLKYDFSSTTGTWETYKQESSTINDFNNGNRNYVFVRESTKKE